MTEQDRQFMDRFSLVIGVLVAYTIFLIFLANSIYDTYAVEDVPQAETVAERIKPVGEVYVGEAPRVAAAEPAAAAPAAAEAPAAEAAPFDAAATYQSSCFACHGTGAAGAPKLGDKAAWEPRIAKGIDTLVNHAINGFNAMPPKGGNMQLTEEQIRAIVEYMTAQAQ